MCRHGMDCHIGTTYDALLIGQSFRKSVVLPSGCFPAAQAAHRAGITIADHYVREIL